jgi:hypothetical protein
MSYSEFVKKNYDKSKTFAQNTKAISAMWHKQKGTKKTKKKGGMIRKPRPVEHEEQPNDHLTILRGDVVEPNAVNHPQSAYYIERDGIKNVPPGMLRPRPRKRVPPTPDKFVPPGTVTVRKPRKKAELPQNVDLIPARTPTKPKPEKTGEGRRKRGGQKMVPGPDADAYLARVKLAVMPKYGSGMISAQKFGPPPFFSSMR